MSAPAAITKYHSLSRLNTRHLFLPVLEAGKPNIKVSVDSVSGESSLPGLQIAAFLPRPRLVENASFLSSSSYIGA